MSDLAGTISKVEIVAELVENKDVKLLAGIFLEYLKEEQKEKKPPLGFSGEEKNET